MHLICNRFNLCWTLGILFSIFCSTQLQANPKLTTDLKLDHLTVNGLDLNSKSVALTVKPWELSPSLTSKFETQRLPGWVDPKPFDPKDIDLPSKTDFYHFLKRPPPAAFVERVSPSKFPKLPWFSLNKIPKVPKVVQVEEQKVLTPSITGSFQVDGRIAIFKTSDEHLYYVVPNRWMVSLNGYALEYEKVDPKNAKRRLRFLLSPSYSWADELIASIKEIDNSALFVPIPKKIVGFQLDIPEVLGEVKNQILPTDGMPIGDQIYMSLVLDEEAVEIFKMLSDAKTFLTGSVKFTYPYDEKTNFELISDIWLNL